MQSTSGALAPRADVRPAAKTPRQNLYRVSTPEDRRRHAAILAAYQAAEAEVGGDTLWPAARAVSVLLGRSPSAVLDGAEAARQRLRLLEAVPEPEPAQRAERAALRAALRAWEGQW